MVRNRPSSQPGRPAANPVPMPARKAPVARRKTPSDPQPSLFADDPPPDRSPAGPASPPGPAATCHRHWLDPRCGILASAADWLLAEARSAELDGRGPEGTGGDAAVVDLSAFTVVVPGRAAGHRLIEILIDKTAPREAHMAAGQAAGSSRRGRSRSAHSRRRSTNRPSRSPTRPPRRSAGLWRSPLPATATGI